MELWFHLANDVYVFSYLVTDILWLRVLSVVGGFSYLTWTLTTPTPSLSLIGWTLVYNTINVVQIARLWYERRPLRLDDREQALYTSTFRTLTPREFRRRRAGSAPPTTGALGYRRRLSPAPTPTSDPCWR
jgi:hypothetical protein